MKLLSTAVALVLFWITTSLYGDGPTDNQIGNVRTIPPVGLAIEESVRTRLSNTVHALQDKLIEAVKQDTSRMSSLSEIEVLVRAVQLAVEDQLFYDANDVQRADQLLLLADDRLASYADGASTHQILGIDKPSDKAQLTIGGFRSRIDGSVQPYGLVVPAKWNPSSKTPLRLDVWLHGRGENQLELQFLDQRLHQIGQISPEETFVLHPFGRYSNAFKFAGEIDILEAIEHIQRIVPIDPRRISIRGFSMGGAGCWQAAVHYPGRWFAATPGAGFSETTEFLRTFQGETISPSDAQRKLLHWYDATDWANNLRLLPTIAYSGELDRQKQAADMMAAAFQQRELKLNHLIGPQMGHKIDPDSAIQIDKFLLHQSQAVSPRPPQKIDFTTYTLRYAQNAWLRIDGLERHWQESRVQAEWIEPRTIRLQTRGVTQLSISFEKDECPFVGAVEVDINGTLAQGPPVAEDGSLRFSLKQEDGKWFLLDGEDKSLRKRPGLQGPIDDAFMSSFVFVRPSKPCTHGIVERWTIEEFKHATTEWRRHFRGDAKIVYDTEVSEQDIKNSNLIIFGDPVANQFLTNIVRQLPLTWTKEVLRIGGKPFDAVNHAAVMVFPNPLNRDRYIVLNSGFTFREYAYLNNARQISMLPDWAILNVTPGNTNYQMPGTVVDEGFFDEQWGLPETVVPEDAGK